MVILRKLPNILQKTLNSNNVHARGIDIINLNYLYPPDINK